MNCRFFIYEFYKYIFVLIGVFMHSKPDSKISGILSVCFPCYVLVYFEVKTSLSLLKYVSVSLCHASELRSYQY